MTKQLTPLRRKDQATGYAQAVKDIVTWLQEGDERFLACMMEEKFKTGPTTIDSDQAVRDEVKLIADWFWGMGMRQTASAIEDGDYKK